MEHRRLLEIDDASIDHISKEFGTPLYVVSENRLRQNFREFKEVFVSEYDNVSIAYSYKTNYLPIICKVLDEEGALAEIVSGFELYIANRIGVNPRKIIFNGPAKTEDELAKAAESQIGVINIDSLSELQKILKIAKTFKEKINIGIRLRSPHRPRGITKFGIDVENGQALEVCRIIAKSDNLRLVGLHGHMGTLINVPSFYADLAKFLVDFAAIIRKEIGVRIKIIDLGGGFAVPGVRPLLPQEQIPTLREYAQAISKAVGSEVTRTGLEKPELVLEPGRALISSAVSLLVKVVAVKSNPAEEIVITDGGINLLPFAPYEIYPIIPVSYTEKEKKIIEIGGPLCMEADFLGERRVLPQMQEGDLLLVMHAGAYTISQSIQFIKPRPGVIMIHKDKASWIRKPETFDHILALDNFNLDI